MLKIDFMLIISIEYYLCGFNSFTASRNNVFQLSDCIGRIKKLNNEIIQIKEKFSFQL